MTPRKLTGLVFGVSLLGGVASAEPFIATFEAHNDMHAGALWRNDRPNNNNQSFIGAPQRLLQSNFPKPMPERRPTQAGPRQEHEG